MSVRVDSVTALPADADCAIGEPVSTTQLGHPIAVSANHAIGYLLGGLRHCQRAFTPQSTAGTARIYSHRHPNCEYIDVFAVLEGPLSQNPWCISVQAGNGVTQSVSSVDSSFIPGSMRIRAPWAASDAGTEAITVTTVQKSIRALAIYDVPRETLSTGDTRVDSFDSTYPRIGILPERALAASASAGPLALVDTVTSAWEDHRPQHMSWWTWETEAKSTDASSYGGAGAASDFLGVPIYFRARQKTSGQNRGTVTFSIYCWTTDGDTVGELQVSSANPGAGADGSNLSAQFSGSTPGRRDIEVEVDCTTDASILIEAKVVSGAGDVFISAVSALGAA